MLRLYLCSPGDLILLTTYRASDALRSTVLSIFSEAEADRSSIQDIARTLSLEGVALNVVKSDSIPDQSELEKNLLVSLLEAQPEAITLTEVVED